MCSVAIDHNIIRAAGCLLGLNGGDAGAVLADGAADDRDECVRGARFAYTGR